MAFRWYFFIITSLTYKRLSTQFSNFLLTNKNLINVPKSKKTKITEEKIESLNCI